MCFLGIGFNRILIYIQEKPPISFAMFPFVHIKTDPFLFEFDVNICYGIFPYDTVSITAKGKEYLFLKKKIVTIQLIEKNSKHI